MNIRNIGNSVYFKGIQPSIPNIFAPFSSQNLSQIKDITPLQSGVSAIIPNNSQLRLGNDYSLNIRNPKIQDALDKKGSITIGTSKEANISLPDFYNKVNNQHLQLEKQGTKVIARNLSTTYGTEIIPKDKIKAFQVSTKNLKLAQGEIGDCFVLATLYSLSQTQNGQKIIEDMVKVDDTGNHIVTFKNQKPITITLGELDSERETTAKDWACGEMGTKAIERAYAKLIKTNQAMCNSIEIDKGGRIVDALKLMTDKKCDMYEIKEMEIDSLLTDIENKGLGNQFITCSTPHICKYGNFMNSEGKFITGHAYSIKSINTKDKTIEIVNPHNTKQSETITWEEFKTMFEYIYIANI